MVTNGGFQGINLDSVIKNDVEKKKSKLGAHRVITCKEYVEKYIAKDPLIAQNSAARLWEIIQDAGTEPVPEDEQMFIGVKERYKLFSSELYGIDKAVNQLVNHIRVGANRGSTGKQVLVLVGPPAAGKSTSLRVLMKALEAYNKRPVFQIQGCPRQEEPLHLLPRHMRDQMALRPEDCEECQKDKNPEHLHLGVKIIGDLCPVCRHTLTETYTEKKDKDDPYYKIQRWWDVPVETFNFSMQSRRGIGSFEPSDEKSSDVTALTGRENMGITTAYGQTHHLAYELSGEIPASERGLLEGREILQCDPEVLRVFFSVAEEQELKIQGSAFPHLKVDIVVIGHTNFKVFKDFNAKKEYEGLHDRFLVVPVGYPLRINDEVALYKKLINRDSDFTRLRKCHIAPGTLELAALFAVMTRFKKSGLDVDFLTKAKLYNGDRAITMLRDKDKHPIEISSLVEEGQSDSDISKREGMFGVSSRTVLAALNGAIVQEKEGGCLTPLRAIQPLRTIFDQRMGFTPEQVETYRMLLTSGEAQNVMMEYRNFVIETLTKAYVAAYSDMAQELFRKYMSEIKLKFSQTTKIVRGQMRFVERDPISGKVREADEKFMRSIEEHLGWSEQQAQVARGELLQSLALEGDKFSYDSYPPLARACEKKLIGDNKNTLSIILSKDRLQSSDDRKRYDDLYTNLKGTGFCDICAQEATDKATEFLRE